MLLTICNAQSAFYCMTEHCKTFLTLTLALFDCIYLRAKAVFACSIVSTVLRDSLFVPECPSYSD